MFCNLKAATIVNTRSYISRHKEWKLQKFVALILILQLRLIFNWVGYDYLLFIVFKNAIFDNFLHHDKFLRIGCLEVISSFRWDSQPHHRLGCCCLHRFLLMIHLLLLLVLFIKSVTSDDLSSITHSMIFLTNFTWKLYLIMFAGSHRWSCGFLFERAVMGSLVRISDDGDGRLYNQLVVELRAIYFRPQCYSSIRLLTF